MEKTDWNDKMDALEVIWRDKMAETRVEYQKVREMLNKRELINKNSVFNFREKKA